MAQAAKDHPLLTSILIGEKHAIIRKIVKSHGVGVKDHGGIAENASIHILQSDH
jgi:hypothetical protein